MNHKIVFSFLEPVSEKWSEISQELGISDEGRQKITKASETSPTNPIMCCSRMVEEWLMGSELSPSWHTLSEALRSLNMEQLADEVLLLWGT